MDDVDHVNATIASWPGRAPGEPAPISVLLLARDETAELEALIPALSFAREIVVVWDPSGERATRAAAERLGARVCERAFDGFGPQRAFALAQCSQDWVLWLDADERLDAKAVESLLRVTADSVERAIASGSNVAPASGSNVATAPGSQPLTHFRLARATWFLGARIRFCGWQGDAVVRLFRRERARFDDAPVHETVRVDGPGPGRLAGVIEHHSYRTFADCSAKCVRYAAAGAAKAYARGHRAGALDVLARPPLRFLRQYVLQFGFLDGAHGLVLCAFAAAQVFFKYAELWERTRAGTRT
ncbi:MAG TPA: glycosyltransferase family 2 protein [Candidatus Eisenbacteria bacterium]|jgi:hypothetical protein